VVLPEQQQLEHVPEVQVVVAVLIMVQVEQEILLP
tara:strand:+ start:421 stop:525 length:105 start_codon:yes stop_codon:yes gene_type:complete